MLDINKLKPLPDIDFNKASLRDIDADYLEYYGIHFSKTLSGVRHYFGSLDLAGFNIAVHHFKQSDIKPTVLVVHGYTDHVGLYNYFFKQLLDAGFNIVTFDLPGHGLSSGEPAGIASFQDYQAVLDALLQSLPKGLLTDLYIAGQSTGGSIAADYILNNPKHPFKKLLLLAPLVIPRNWRWIKMQLSAIGSFVHQVPRDFTINCSNTQFLRFLKYNDPTQVKTLKASWVRALFNWQPHFSASPASNIPCLIIQGDEDKTVDWLYNTKRLSEKFTSAKVVLIPKAGHHLVKELSFLREKVFKEALEFLHD